MVGDTRSVLLFVRSACATSAAAQLCRGNFARRAGILEDLAFEVRAHENMRLSSENGFQYTKCSVELLISSEFMAFSNRRTSGFSFVDICQQVLSQLFIHGPSRCLALRLSYVCRQTWELVVLRPLEDAVKIAAFSWYSEVLECDRHVCVPSERSYVGTGFAHE